MTHRTLKSGLVAISLVSIGATVLLCMSSCGLEAAGAQAAAPAINGKVDYYHGSDPRFAALRDEMQARVDAALNCLPQPSTTQQQIDALRGMVEEEIRWLEFCDKATFYRVPEWTANPLWVDGQVAIGSLETHWGFATKDLSKVDDANAQKRAAEMVAWCRRDLPKVHAVRRMMMRDTLDDVFKVPTDYVKHIAPKRP